MLDVLLKLYRFLTLKNTFLFSGLFCYPFNCWACCQFLAPSCRTRSPNCLWSNGWTWRLSYSCTWQTFGILLDAQGQMVHYVHASGTSYPRPGQICLHLQWMQTPCRDTMALHSMWGKYVHDLDNVGLFSPLQYSYSNVIVLNIYTVRAFLCIMHVLKKKYGLCVGLLVFVLMLSFLYPCLGLWFVHHMLYYKNPWTQNGETWPWLGWWE